MKRHFIHLIFGLLGVTGLVSCVDDHFLEDARRQEGNMEGVALSISGESLVLREIQYRDDAVSLNWTPGTNYGTGNKILYTLEIDKAGNGFSNPFVAVEDRAQVYSWSASVEKLNDILMDKFGNEGGEPLSLEARITARVPESSNVQQSTVAFTVTPYTPVTSTLYLIGDATPNGWSADNATPMKRRDKGVFTWTGNLKNGHFKFITTLGEFVPSYNRGSDGKLVYRASFDDPDEQWEISENYTYEVNVNLLTGDISFTKAERETPRFNMLYLIGNMTGWSFVPFDRADILDPFLIRLGYKFDKGGDFKFGTASGSWENNYKAVVGNAPYTDQRTVFVEGFDPDDKWVLKDDELGYYKICFDVRRDRERMIMTPFTPYEGIYLIGSATSAGWSLGDAVPMSADPSDPCVFTWEGELQSGELKFTCDKQGDWMGAWFMSDENGKEPAGTEEKMLFIDKSDEVFKAQYIEFSVNDIDQKWQISTPGTYEIILNQIKETVIIRKK